MDILLTLIPRGISCGWKEREKKVKVGLGTSQWWADEKEEEEGGSIAAENIAWQLDHVDTCLIFGFGRWKERKWKWQGGYKQTITCQKYNMTPRLLWDVFAFGLCGQRESESDKYV